ncbi:MAG: hypothetical protein HZA91_02610 [Verrucomicrobia bacterium]|nr:hypothetical protein [Verrucomicrobiota bacterium]
MNASALELLELAAATYGVLSRPTLSNLMNFGHRLHRDASYRQALWRLQQSRLLERVAHGSEIEWRLTQAGRRRLAELRDTTRLRRRSWDGRWRLVTFDFPEASRKQRDTFRWWLRVERLGQLQKSVWISAFPLSHELQRFLDESSKLNWILQFESPEKGPISDADIAARAWPLARLAEEYDNFIGDCLRRLGALAEGQAALQELGQWRHEASAVYGELLRRDPFLPQRLLPPRFPGARADDVHQQLIRALVQAAARIKR